LVVVHASWGPDLLANAASRIGPHFASSYCGSRPAFVRELVSYIVPAAVVDRMGTAGAAKLTQTTGQVLLRSALGAGILSLAVCLAVTASQQTGTKLVGALVFPVGFCVLVLLGLDLVTGNFALAPMPLLRGESTRISPIVRSLALAFSGNLIGSLSIAGLVAASLTMGFSEFGAPDAEAIRAIARAKTLGYAEHGASGLLAVVVRAILCNWMVTLGVVMALTSTSVGGKIAAMWLPIFLFFALGYEHAVVNMFVIPLGMLLGAGVSFSDWWLWNQIPVTIGNLAGGLVLTALALERVHGSKPEAIGPEIVPVGGEGGPGGPAWTHPGERS
jgi:formate/nitrite transporter